MNSFLTVLVCVASVSADNMNSQVGLMELKVIVKINFPYQSAVSQMEASPSGYNNHLAQAMSPNGLNTAHVQSPMQQPLNSVYGTAQPIGNPNGYFSSLQQPSSIQTISYGGADILSQYTSPGIENQRQIGQYGNAPNLLRGIPMNNPSRRYYPYYASPILGGSLLGSTMTSPPYLGAPVYSSPMIGSPYVTSVPSYDPLFNPLITVYWRTRQQ